MRPLLFFFLLLVSSSTGVLSAQVKAGEMLNEQVRLSDSSGSSVILKIPSDSCLLFYRIRGKNWLPDSRDSMQKVDQIVRQLKSSSSTFNNLQVICYSYNLDKYLTKAPVKAEFPSTGNKTTESFYLNEKSNSRILNGDKLILVNRRGKVLTTTPFISAYHYQHVDDINIVKAKLLTDKDGTRKPLTNATVYLHNGETTETDKSTKTDDDGDFEVAVLDNNDQHTIRIVPAEKDLGSIILATQDGVELSRVYLKPDVFEYRLLEADIVRLSELHVLDEISMEAGKFSGSREKEWIRSEFITYDPGSYQIRSESKKLLDRIAVVMAENPSMKLEVISHTSSQLDDASNQVMSAKRSLNVISYLVLIGVEKDRLTYKGKSEKDLTHSLNQQAGKERTEFRFSK